MLAEYAPILIFLIIAGALGVILLLLGMALGRGQKDPEKQSPYECGFEAFEDTRMRFDVRYYWLHPGHFSTRDHPSCSLGGFP